MTKEAQGSLAEMVASDLSGVRNAYAELMAAVVPCEGETLHETALRYIQQGGERPAS